MLPFCYEYGLLSGHAPEAAQFVSIAAEVFIKEMLSTVFSRTRSNGSGELGGGSTNPTEGTSWIQTHRYRKQLAREEGAARRGELTRDKSGLLPVESRSAIEQGALGMADLRLALEMGECGMATFPIISQSIMFSYREGELEQWEDYTWMDDGMPKPRDSDHDGDTRMGGGTANGTDHKASGGAPLPNGVSYDQDAMDLDDLDGIWWEGADSDDGGILDGVLDSCLAVG